MCRAVVAFLWLRQRIGAGTEPSGASFPWESTHLTMSTAWLGLDMQAAVTSAPGLALLSGGNSPGEGRVPW